MGEMTFSQFIRNKWVWLFLAIDVIIVIAIIVLSVNNATRDATISFNITPTDATVTLNGQGSYGANGTYLVHPGSYTIEVSHDGLDTKTFDVTLARGTNTTLTTFLSSSGNVDFYKQKENQLSFDKLREIASYTENNTTDQDTSANEGIARIYGDSLMMQGLPIKDTQYSDTESGRHLDRDITIRVADREDCETWLCLEALMVGTDDQNVVLDLLRRERFNVEDYEIKYKVY